MPRPRNIERKVRAYWWIPESLRARVDLYLWDDILGRVPEGAHSAFVTAAIEDRLNLLQKETNVQS
jgi:hypothetical protein